ncbi:hypothetical protein GK2887 [Geobacillus kaustophilus HTA426]|uniref:Uncharacterized protein n=1 Tax=Geobacillus kaustophilus (strain HTA426) TaxID=235909 RepID=Q5KVW4_GEOKA|nr:hypothetical protein GK2887 [Geobacillus kaustophilus HTA426]
MTTVAHFIPIQGSRWKNKPSFRSCFQARDLLFHRNDPHLHSSSASLPSPSNWNFTWAPTTPARTTACRSSVCMTNTQIAISSMPMETTKPFTAWCSPNACAIGSHCLFTFSLNQKV